MKKSRLSAYKKEKLIEYFVAKTTARIASILVGVNKNTASYFYHRLREIILKESKKTGAIFRCYRS
jgi:transposase